VKIDFKFLLYCPKEGIIYIKFVKITERRVYLLSTGIQIITDASVIGCRSLEAESIRENLKEPLFPSGTGYGYIPSELKVR